MSQENVELHYRVIDAVNRRDLDAVLALADDDVEGIPRAGAWRAAITATKESAAGGRTCSTSGPTSASRLSKCATLET
jgi:hypothetical protein